MVLTGNGAILPVEEIAAIVQSKGGHLIVDGAHALGAIPLVLNNKSNISFYGGNLHKWMMGLAGTGFGWINPQYSENNTLNSQFKGWPNYDNGAHLEPFKLSGTAKEFNTAIL